MKVKFATFKHKASTAAKQLLLAATVAGVGVAHAAVDTTDVLEAITDAGTAIAAVGAAWLAMRIGARVFKWISASI